MRKITILLITLLANSSVMAASLSDAMNSCKVESNSLKRLVCYDKLAKRLNQFTDENIAEVRIHQPVSRSSSDTVVYNTPTPDHRSPEDKFGLKAAELIQAPEKIGSTIVKVKANPFGHLTVTLANGQVWRQAETKEMRLKKGDQVFIKEGALGSYFLGKTGTHQSSRFKRIK